MKRIILSVMVLAFAAAVQAGDTKPAQDTPSCCSSKVKVSTDAKEGTCPMAKASCSSKVEVSTDAKEGTCPMAKASCCKQGSAKQTAAKQPKQPKLMSPKATSLASN
jgi:hypothetical protein